MEVTACTDQPVCNPKFAEVLHMNVFIKPCPNCGHRFRWKERARGFRCLGFVRKVVICPGCGASVIWSKRPWRMMIVGGIVGAVVLPVGLIMDLDHPVMPLAISWAAVVFLGSFTAIVGCFTLRFELLGAANRHLQPTPG